MPINVKVSGSDKGVFDLKVRVSGVDKNINHVFQKTANGDKTIWRRWKGLQYIRGPSVPSSNYGFAEGVYLTKTTNSTFKGRVLLCPMSSTTLRFYTPPSGEITPSSIGTSEAGISHGGTASYNYVGGVELPDGRVVLCPYDTANVRVWNPATNTISASVSHGVSGTYPTAFGGGCYVEAVPAQQGGSLPSQPERVVFTPYGSSTVRWYNVATNTMISGVAHGQGNSAFVGHGIRLQNGKILFPNYNSHYAGIFDPHTNSYTNGSWYLYDSNLFGGGVLLPDGRVLFVPRSSTSIWVYDPMTGATKNVLHGRGSMAFTGGILLADLGKVILIPHKSTHIGIYDIATNTYSNGPVHGESYGGGDYYWHGGVYLPEKKTIVMIPRGCNYIGLIKVME